MTPFSRTLETLRRNKGFSQTDLASMAGVRANYISTLENSRKLPSEALLEKIIDCLRLNQNETEQLKHDFEISRFSLKAPIKASREEFELLYMMKDYVGNLTSSQIQLLKMALQIEDEMKSERGIQ